MSFAVPLMKPTLEGKHDAKLNLTEHGVHDTLGFGFRKIKESVSTVHPLENSEKYHMQNHVAAQMAAMRNLQGLHAPLKLSSELKATRAVGRLPFLESSGLSTATVLGSDDRIDFSDILNLPEWDERHLVPHVVMEKRFGDF